MVKINDLFNKIIKINTPNILSLYLTTDPTVVGRNRAGAMIWLKDSLRNIKKSIRSDEQKLFEILEEKIIREVENNNSFSKSLIAFTGPDFFEIAPTNVEVKNDIWWGKPSLGQLEWLLTEYRNFGVIKIHPEKLHYYVIGLNELISDWEEKIDTNTLAWQSKHFPPEDILREKAIPGLRGGDTKEILERHVFEDVQKFWKNSNKSIEKLKKNYHINEVILSGLDTQIEAFQKVANLVSLNIIGSFSFSKDLNQKDFIHNASNIFRDSERNKEKTLVNEIVSRSKENSLASLGIKDVLRIVQEGRAAVTAITSSTDQILLECNNCGYVMPLDYENCNMCSSENLRIGSTRSLIPPLLRKYKSKLNIVSNNISESLNENEGIGVLWKY